MRVSCSRIDNNEVCHETVFVTLPGCTVIRGCSGTLPAPGSTIMRVLLQDQP
jgi:hypothetical protein